MSKNLADSVRACIKLLTCQALLSLRSRSGDHSRIS